MSQETLKLEQGSAAVEGAPVGYIQEIKPEEDGAYSVSLPSDQIMPGAGVLLERIKFDSQKEAQKALAAAPERQRLIEEWYSLSRSFDASYNIRREDEKYVVETPGFINEENGWYIGTNRREFATWDEAKQAYLASLENGEDLIHRPILTLDFPDNKLSFLNAKGLVAEVAPTREAYTLPETVGEYIKEKEEEAMNDHSGETYRRTIAEERWQNELFSFVENYLKKNKELKKRLEIEDLRGLSPRQAIELANEIVIDLKKYDRREVANTQQIQDTLRAGGVYKSEYTDHDKSTALKILKEGEKNKGNSDWQGNGVCRNFACTVKAIFESLKEMQVPDSRLRNTYCLLEGGNRDVFDPKRDDWMGTKIESSAGHAWNTFVIISKKGDAKVVSTDVTWARRDLETGSVTGIDHTLVRMDPLVRKSLSEMGDDLPDKQTQLRRVLAYYALHMERAGIKSEAAENSQFFMTEALKLIYANQLYEDLPKNFVQNLNTEFLNIADSVTDREIEILWNIYQRNQKDVEFVKIFKEVIKRSVSPQTFLFYKQDDLQKMVIDILSAEERDGYLTGNMAFRVRAREVVPNLFSEFNPDENDIDLKELRHLAVINGLRFTMISHRSASDIIGKARQNLESMNKELYPSQVSGLSDWEVVRKYRELARQLSEK